MLMVFKPFLAGETNTRSAVYRAKRMSTRVVEVTHCKNVELSKKIYFLSDEFTYFDILTLKRRNIHYNYVNSNTKKMTDKIV